jgi:hypothetical protein
MEIQSQSQGLGDEHGSDEIRQRFMKHVLGSLPITLQSHFNQQLRAWDTLFPYERRYLLSVLTYLDDLSEDERASLLRGIRRVEKDMGVSIWRSYSTRDQTLENASLLARSPYYLEWRKEVGKVVDQIDRETQAKEGKPGPSPRRLILLIFPSFLPMAADTVWENWPSTGKQLSIDLDSSGDEHTFLQALFAPGGPAGHTASGNLMESFTRRAGRSLTDVWVLDAGSTLSEFFLEQSSQSEQPQNPTVLSFERLRPFREKFLAEINQVRHELSSADEIYDQLRKMETGPLCPPEVNTHPTVREFVRSLLLSGNGSAVFANAFLEWGAAEVLRRARPSVLVGSFGTRDKPKPFTSVAIFENQSIASPLPSVKDFPGSALDAQVLAYYVWLASARYPEYQDALTLCLAENLQRGFVLGPPGNPLATAAEPLSLSRISSLLGAWLA